MNTDRSPVHKPRREQEADWTAPPRSDEPGFGRGLVVGLAGTNVAANIIELPPGQGCPTHDFSGDVIIYVIDGEVDYSFGAEKIHLATGDLLFIPQRVAYGYANAGTGTARLLSMIGAVDEWPGVATYAGVEGSVTLH